MKESFSHLGPEDKQTEIKTVDTYVLFGHLMVDSKDSTLSPVSQVQYSWIVGEFYK